MLIKKNILLVSVFLILINIISAKEMNLHNNYPTKEFEKLTIEEQYTSYMNSFMYRSIVREQPHKWAISMVKQYGRDVLPFFNQTLQDLKLEDFSEKRNTPQLQACLDYLLIVFNDYEILTENEKNLYAQILKGKIDLYVYKYRVIDYIVRSAYGSLSLLYYTYDKNESKDKNVLAAYYKERLEIDDVRVVDDWLWQEGI